MKCVALSCTWQTTRSPKHHTFAAFIAVDPLDALAAAIQAARVAETVGQRVEDFHTVNVRVVKITEEEVI